MRRSTNGRPSILWYESTVVRGMRMHLPAWVPVMMRHFKVEFDACTESSVTCAYSRSPHAT